MAGLLLMALPSCSLFGGGKKAQAQASEDSKNKGKIRKCRLESCHVRMIHEHEGALYFGKKHWFLKSWFYMGKNPQVGEGFGKMRRDPHQDAMRKSSKKRKR
ncbi:MAG: hypothetical protein NZM34_09860 [Bernardetiaceae bacterium]|nr:hypothetical protein [Bernardetiaceae bacterium]